MNDLLFLLPITILGIIGAIFGTWMKISADRDERKERQQSGTHH
jgi:hypothetical protein